MHAADVVGDVRTDLIVGLPGPAYRVAYVVAGGLMESGSVPLAEVAERVVTGAGQSNLGWDVGAGDLDGNGRSDLIVSSWQINDPDPPTMEFADVGKTFVFYGPEPDLRSILRVALLGLIALATRRRTSHRVGLRSLAQR
jgi:hypothetical protein